MPYDPKAIPSAAEIEKESTFLFGLWSEAVTQWRAADAAYYRTTELWPEGTLQAGKPEYHPSTATSVIDHAADTQMAFEPRFHREPKSESKDDREEANAIEVAMAAIFEDAGLKEPALPWKKGGRFLIHLGRGVYEAPMWDASERPSKPVRRQSESDEEFTARNAQHTNALRHWNPIRIRPIHPARVAMDPLEKQPSLVIKKEKMYNRRVWELSQAKKNRKLWEEFLWDGKDPFAVKTIMHRWTPLWHVVKIADAGEAEQSSAKGQMLWAEKNTWGFVPYQHAFAGFGMEPTEADDMNPKYEAVGLLHPILESLKVQAQGRTAQHHIHMEAAYAPMGTERDPQEVAEQMENSDILQGQEEEYWRLKVHELPRWMYQENSVVDDDIQIGSYVRDLAGRRQEGVVTVGQQAILANASQRKFAGPNKQLEEMASLIAQKVMQLIVTTKKSIGARGKVLTPKMIGNDFNMRVTFEVLDPVLDLQRREVGMRELDRDIIDKQTYREVHGRYPDGAKIEKRLLVQAIKEHPLVHGQLAEQAAKEADLLDEWREARRLEAEAAHDGRTTEANQRVNGVTASPEAGGPERAVETLRDPLSSQTAQPPRP